MKMLVLGSKGQIGSALTNFLTNKNYLVYTFDIAADVLEDLRIHNNTLLEHYIKNSDFVYFLAFDVGGSRYLKKYQHTYEFIDNNIRLMNETFSLLKKHNKPFIFASSQMSNMSYSPYGILKAVGETYTKSLNGLIVKFWNVYGIEHDLEKSHVVTDFILSAKNKNKIEMLTDGQEERQMLYADDCCEALEILSQKYNEIDREKQLHITSFEWIKIIDIANIIKNEYPDILILPSKEKDSVQLNKRNEPDSFVLNYWKPKTSLEAGIKKIIKCII